MKLQIPNTLTIGRIILVPLFVIAFYLPGLLGDLIPFFIFLLASFTDFLDGLLARLYKEESKLGELLDPIADKIIVATALVLLVMNDIIINYEVIAAIIILTREILISGLREFLAKSQITMPVSGLAKFICLTFNRAKYLSPFFGALISPSTESPVLKPNFLIWLGLT